MQDWSALEFFQTHRGGFGLLALCAAVTLLLGYCVWAVHRGKRRCWSLDESGGLSEELVLVFPFFLLFLAITIQYVLVMHARLVVNYAAFVTGRSASVWIPMRMPGESSNSVRLRSQDPAKGGDAAALANPSGKLDRMRSAAVLACAPISPSIQTWWRDYINHFSLFGNKVPPALTDVTDRGLNIANSFFEQTGLAGNVTRLIPRWAYSSLFTQVILDDTSKLDAKTFGETEDITIAVEHQFYVTVPFIGRIIGKSYTELLEKYTWGYASANLYYVPIKETYTFHNEGEKLFPGYER